MLDLLTLPTLPLHLASGRLLNKKRRNRADKEALNVLDDLIVSYMGGKLSDERLARLVGGEIPFYIHKINGRFHYKTLGFYIDSNPFSKERYRVEHLSKIRKRAFKKTRKTAF